MADDSGGRRSFMMDLNGQRWSRQPYRPSLKHPIQFQVAASNRVGRLKLGPNGHRPPETVSHFYNVIPQILLAYPGAHINAGKQKMNSYFNSLIVGK